MSAPLPGRPSILSLTWILLLTAVACGPRETVAPPPPAGEAPLEAIVPPEGLSGWSLLLEAVLGEDGNDALHLEVKVGPGFFTLLFPSNGVLPGMQVRAAGARRVLVDPATSRYARLTGARQDFLGLPEPLPTTTALTREEDGTVRIRATVLLPHGLSSWHELTLTIDPAGLGPPVRELLGLLTAPVPLRLPPSVLELPLASWTWRHASHGRTGQSRFHILRAEPVALQRGDLVQDFPRYSLRQLPDLLPGAQASDGRRGAWVISSGPMGILFVDGRLHGFLPVRRPLYLGPRELVEVMVVPVLGGPPVWRGTVRGPDVWTIDD